jgi:hypothetical protein
VGTFWALLLNLCDEMGLVVTVAGCSQCPTASPGCEDVRSVCLLCAMEGSCVVGRSAEGGTEVGGDAVGGLSAGG